MYDYYQVLLKTKKVDTYLVDKYRLTEIWLFFFYVVETQCIASPQHRKKFFNQREMKESKNLIDEVLKF